MFNDLSAGQERRVNFLSDTGPGLSSDSDVLAL